MQFVSLLWTISIKWISNYKTLLVHYAGGAAYKMRSSCIYGVKLARANSRIAAPTAQGCDSANTLSKDRADNYTAPFGVHSVRFQLRFRIVTQVRLYGHQTQQKNNHPRCGSCPQTGVAFLVVTVYLSTAIYHFSTTFQNDRGLILDYSRTIVANLRILGYKIPLFDTKNH